MKEKKKLILNTEITFENKNYYYVDIGKAKDWKPSFRLWVNREVTLAFYDNKGKEILFILLPAICTKVERTEDGTIIMRKNEEGYHTYYLDALICGYSGESNFEVVNDPDALIYIFEEYQSPKGNLGIKRGGLITSKKTELIIKAIINGRDINEEYFLKLDLDGNKEEIEIPNFKDMKLLE